ncbi:YraN family protein [Paracoccus sp. (in: a-proteobacteria)]|uniref:YraN family protein n=1 Tax=Paracoccus sp. TaxID=267 RepID=UPI00396C3990
MRRQRGRVAALSGRMAEEAVLRHYVLQGGDLLASRWKGAAGEIDLILRLDEEIVFVEVKAARSHDEAALRLLPSQMQRITRAACEFCEARGWSLGVPMRFDAALVDGTGRVQVIPNAFGEM